MLPAIMPLFKFDQLKKKDEMANNYLIWEAAESVERFLVPLGSDRISGSCSELVWELTVGS